MTIRSGALPCHQHLSAAADGGDHEPSLGIHPVALQHPVLSVEEAGDRGSGGVTRPGAAAPDFLMVLMPLTLGAPAGGRVGLDTHPGGRCDGWICAAR